MKNFGAFKNPSIFKLNETEQAVLMKKNHLCSLDEIARSDYIPKERKKPNIFSRLFTPKVKKENNASLNSKVLSLKSPLDHIPKLVKLSEDFKNEIYNYLTVTYKREITIRYEILALEIKKKTLGLNDNKKRDLVLDYFKVEIFSIIDPNAIALNATIKTNLDGIPDYFDAILKKRNTFKDLLNEENELYLNYLAGNGLLFKKGIGNDILYVNHFIEFESKVNVIIKLNEVYTYIDDHELIGPTELSQLFKENDDLFLDFKGLRFLDHYLKETKNIKKTHVDSLFAALYESKLIKNSKKRFKEFVNRNYNLTFKITEIKTMDKTYSNQSALDKTEKIVKEISEF